MTRDIRAEMAALVRPGDEKFYQDRLQKFEPELQQLILKPDRDRTPHERQIVFQTMRNFESGKNAGIKELEKHKDQKARYDSLVKKLAEFDHLKPAPLPRAMISGMT